MSGGLSPQDRVAEARARREAETAGAWSRTDSGDVAEIRTRLLRADGTEQAYRAVVRGPKSEVEFVQELP